MDISLLWLWERASDRGEEITMMRRLRFCCEGADISKETEPKEQKIIPAQTEPYDPKSGEASVIPAKRKLVKTMICNCVIHCICGNCYKTKAKAKVKTLPPPTSTAPSFKNTGNSVCSCSSSQPLHGAGN